MDELDAEVDETNGEVRAAGDDVKLLRRAKWVFYSVKLILLSVAGGLARLSTRDRKCVVLSGEMNYSGGTFAYFRSLMDLFLHEGYRVEVILSRRNYARPLGVAAQERGIRVTLVPRTFAAIEYLVFLWHVIRVRPSFAVVSASGPGRHTLSMLWSLPTVQIFHSAPELDIGLRERRVFRWFLRSPHVVVAVSRYAQSAIRRHFGMLSHQAGRVHCIYNGVDDQGPGPVTGLSFSDVVTTVGHVVDYKNPETWLQTARYVNERSSRPVRFLWAGDGPELESFRRKAEKNPHAAFLGFRTDVPELVRNTAVYYQPSRWESFGLTVAQAMSMGVPCVVSNRGGLPELIEDGQSGYVCDSEDAAAQGDAILRLLQDPPLRRKMSEAARDRYLSRFTLSGWGRQIMDLATRSARRN